MDIQRDNTPPSLHGDTESTPHLPGDVSLPLLQYVLYPALLLPWLCYYSLYTLNQGRFNTLLSVLKQRFGWYSHNKLTAAPGVWIHGVSVGEVMCIPPLVEQLMDGNPNRNHLITTSTLTGQNVARKHLPSATIAYFPIDLPSCVRRAFRAFQPELLLLVEQEIWPNVLREANRRNVPVVVVNGRMTETSAGRFRRLPGRYRDRMFGGLSAVIAQNKAYAERFHRLGVPNDRLFVSGNVKYDAIISNKPDEASIDELRERYGTSSRNPVLVGGSIHPPEEEALLDAFKALRDSAPDAKLILAPRHLKNTDRIVQAGNDRDLRVLTHDRTGTDHRNKQSAADVIVVNEMGLLTAVYGLADLVFVGGSLIEHGGQNVLEPAVHGVPIVTGPHTFNFEDEVHMLQESGGLNVVRNRNELIQHVRSLAENPEAYRNIGRKARDAIHQHHGAAARTIDLLRRHHFLSTPGSSSP